MAGKQLVIPTLSIKERQVYCYICWHNDRGQVPAVNICNEIKKPVCRHHAVYCISDGHGVLELPSRRKPQSCTSNEDPDTPATTETHS